MLSIRRATKDDASRLLQWKNDALARNFSILSKEPIALADHLEWLDKRLGDPSTELNIVEVDGAPAGDIRLDRLGAETEISVRLAPEFRGRGIAAEAILMMLETKEHVRLFARIVKDNIASIKTFEKCGFKITADCGEWWRLER